MAGDSETAPAGQESAAGDVATISAGATRPGAGAGADAAGPPPGSRLGRFTVDERLGAGGMGVVVSAHDPTLDRRVALKLLHPRLASGHEGSQRLLREAQAMARLQHPNVITVYEVGTVDDQVFLAMELVDGATLAAWVAERPRGLREILDVFVAAGRGLSAAHRAGLVHRDFKPANVLVGRDGRVRVTDFGLVAAERAPAAAGEAVDAEASPAPAAPLTRTGAVMGTPAYMAPEQHLGEPADARADQFAFCVALWEALYGDRPFSGATLPELAARVAAQRLPPAPPGSRVPERIRGLLSRGLSSDPADRHPSLESLLDALAREPRPPRRLRGLAAGGALLVVGAALVIGGRLIAGGGGARAIDCAGGRARLAGVWDAEVHRQVEAGFLATGKPYAAAAVARVAGALDQRAATWVAMHQAACEATYRRHEQSEALFDLQMECLDRRLGELRSLTQLFAHAPDPDLVAHAASAAAGLMPLDDCADAVKLRDAMPLPADPATRARVADVRARQLDALALLRTGKYRESRAMLLGVVGDAREIGWAPLRVETLGLLVDLDMYVGDEAGQAADAEELRQAADAAKDEVALAMALIRLAEMREAAGGGHDEVDKLLSLAKAAVMRAHEPPRLMGFFHGARGMIARGRGDLPGAQRELEKSIEMTERAEGKENPEVAAERINLGLILLDQGDYAGARAELERSLAINRAAYGEDHPQVAISLHNLAIALEAQGDFDGARRAFERALAIEEGALAPDHPSLGALLGDYAGLLLALGDRAAARRAFERSLAIERTHAAGDTNSIAGTIDNLGIIALQEGNLDEARRLSGEALAIKQRILRPADVSIADTLDNVAAVQREAGEYADAIVSYERAIAIYERALGPEHPDLGLLLSHLGECLLRAKRPADALALLERALRILEPSGVDPASLAEARFAAARAVWESGGGKPRARQLAGAARDRYREAGPAFAARVAAVESWLAQRR